MEGQEVTERAHQELKAAVAAVLNGDEGRRVMFWLLEMCAVYGEAFSTDSAMTGYRLGRASIGRQIIAMMNEIDEGLYPRFLLDVAAQRRGEG